MGRGNGTAGDLRTYFKTHSKIREQKAHMSKVTIKSFRKVLFS